jgi:hypothetical protein
VVLNSCSRLSMADVVNFEFAFKKTIESLQKEASLNKLKPKPI